MSFPQIAQLNSRNPKTQKTVFHAVEDGGTFPLHGFMFHDVESSKWSPSMLPGGGVAGHILD